MIKTDVSLGADRNEGREIGSMFSSMGGGKRQSDDLIFLRRNDARLLPALFIC